MSYRIHRCVALASVCSHVLRLSTAVGLAWFGHIRYATPIVHSDDHKDMAHQAIRHLVKEKRVDKDSALAVRADEVAVACGMLDMDEVEWGKTPGKLEWEHSHMYDPVARRGIDDKRDINGLEEFKDWWRRAIVHADIGNYSKAFRFLGYCCHLLQDMAVPSHTHCVSHGFRPGIADNLELVSSSRRFYLREPAGPPYPWQEDLHIELYLAMGRESRGLDPEGPEGPGELAGILEKYYGRPRWTSGGWRGSYRGEPYYPYHRFLPSSPKIELADLVTMRNFLMSRASERTAQLVEHFARATGAGDAP
ncbi:MAG: phospholipase C/P1 nuclease family protein [Candidatus Geothermincolia bacterium]